MTRIARLLAVLLISAAIVSLGTLTGGVAATHPADPESRNPPAAEAESEASVRCLPLGLSGEITAEALVDRLSDSSDNLTFLGTSNGLYVVAPGGKLQHFVYSPFGIRHIALIDDITGDGIREVVVALNDTQVPALRCYDGATWEKLWQFAPMAKIWDDLWVQRQLSIVDLEVISAGSSESVVITSGRRVFSVDAKDGTEQWQFGTSSMLKQMATVADLNGNDTDEMFVGSDDGHLFLLNGKTGQVRWRTRLPEITVSNETIQSTAEHILTLDREAGLVAVASRDSSVRLFDLKGKRVEWEISLPTPDGVSPGPMALVPNTTPDGRPRILVSYRPESSFAAGGLPRVTFLDATGGSLWDTDAYGSSLDLGSYGGKRVILEPKAQELRLIDLEDGKTVIKTISVSTLDGQAPMIQQVGENHFLLVSSGSDLSVMSDSGDTLWNYPRVTNIKAEGGQFVGDSTEDVLLECEWKSSKDGYTPAPAEGDGVIVADAPGYTSQVEEREVRLLQVMDGATRQIAWSYQVPLSDLKVTGGLKGIGVAPDLMGNDGIKDVIAYLGDTVLIFSGKDGTTSSFPAGQPIVSLEVIRNGASGNALAVGIAGGLTIFDSMGAELWTTTSAEWIEDEGGSFMVLDDINSDGKSDLAVLSASKIVVLRSTGSPSDYGLHLIFDAETESSIEYVEIVPDGDGDGVRDLAYFQRATGNEQTGQYTPPRIPRLVERSLVDGKELFSVTLPGAYPAVDLGCGDFNGDGYVDSLASSAEGGRGIANLYVLSGKDGATLWIHILGSRTSSWSGWGTEPLATSVGDVNDDGKDDFAWIVDYESTVPLSIGASDRYRQQQRLGIYDATSRESYREMPVTPLLASAYIQSAAGSALKAGVEIDGHRVMIVSSTEPWVPDYDPDESVQFIPPGQSRQFTSEEQYLAVLDIESGQRLAAFAGLDPAAVSLFETHQAGVMGLAASGSVYFLSIDSSLQITSPEAGARTGPSVGITWEGSTEGDFVQVFVDGVRFDMTNNPKAELHLDRGEHAIVVRSIDDYGRISYGPSDMSSPLTVKVAPSPWGAVLLVLALFALIGIVLLLFYARLHRMWRARRRAT